MPANRRLCQQERECSLMELLGPATQEAGLRGRGRHITPGATFPGGDSEEARVELVLTPGSCALNAQNRAALCPGRQQRATVTGERGHVPSGRRDAGTRPRMDQVVAQASRGLSLESERSV